MRFNKSWDFKQWLQITVIYYTMCYHPPVIRCMVFKVNNVINKSTNSDLSLKKWFRKLEDGKTDPTYWLSLRFLVKTKKTFWHPAPATLSTKTKLIRNITKGTHKGKLFSKISHSSKPPPPPPRWPSSVSRGGGLLKNFETADFPPFLQHKLSRVPYHFPKNKTAAHISAIWKP